jgi:hypothetical protein
MIYIAAPFFNERQAEAVRVVENILGRTGFKFWSPRQHGVIVKELPVAERKSGSIMTKVFEGNVRALDNTNLLFACIDREGAERNADAGTMFELGYYYREAMFDLGNDPEERDGQIHKPSLRSPTIITWSSQGAAANLMISQAAVGHCNNLPCAEEFFNWARKVTENEELSRDEWRELTMSYEQFARADVEEK